MKARVATTATNDQGSGKASYGLVLVKATTKPTIATRSLAMSTDGRARRALVAGCDAWQSNRMAPIASCHNRLGIR